jgi:hemolysin III
MSMQTVAEGATPIPQKPLLRGWFHAAGAVASVVVTIFLGWQSRHDGPKLVSLLIFGATMITLYTVSATYHIGRWPATPARVLRIFDHTNIALFIAGTYTPLCVNLLAGPTRVALLVAIWVLAALNVVVAALTGRVPRWWAPALYVAMGWVAIFALPPLVAAIGWGGVALLFAGGILYSIGALVYARRWPNPFPTVFGFHEIFHLFVIAGSVIFVVVMWHWVLLAPRV